MENSNNTPPPYIGEPMPAIENHLVLAVLTTLFCCLPFGIVSIVYSVQVNSALNARNYELAKINSQKAKYWGESRTLAGPCTKPNLVHIRDWRRIVVCEVPLIK